MKDRGIDALINDCLTGPVLTMGSLFVAYLCALLAYLYLVFTKPGYNQKQRCLHTRDHGIRVPHWLASVSGILNTFGCRHRYPIRRHGLGS